MRAISEAVSVITDLNLSKNLLSEESIPILCNGLLNSNCAIRKLFLNGWYQGLCYTKRLHSG